jgi:hypothetical protein
MSIDLGDKFDVGELGEFGDYGDRALPGEGILEGEFKF